MAEGNEIYCRFLSEDHFLPLYESFTEAYADYIVPFALTEAQFRNHITLNAVDLTRSVGYFEGDRIVGFSLNGFGSWNDLPTVYDAGTGVIPERRRRGLGRKMFEMMMPVFNDQGVQQFVLEVVTTNVPALKLYEETGFRPVRELALLQCDAKSAPDASDINIREIDKVDWGRLTSFWDGTPSWQNSISAFTRSRRMKRLLGAFVRGDIAGYIVFSPKFGRIAQLAVHKKYRRRGIGTGLVRAMERETDDGFSMQVINIDKAMIGAMKFFQRLGFYEKLSQYEMVRSLADGIPHDRIGCGGSDGGGG